MKKVFTVVIFFTAELITATAQKRLARIANGDNYLNIREQESSDSRIIGSIEAGDFFYVTPDEDIWWAAQSLSGKTGYVFHSRVELIDSLPPSELKNLFSNVFENEKEIALNYSFISSKFSLTKKKWESKSDSINFKKTKSLLSKYSREKVFPLLNVFPSYFCQADDSDLARVFLSTFIISSLSDSGEVKNCFARCYRCDSVLVEKIISYFPVLDQKKMQQLIDSIQKNIYPEDRDSIQQMRE